MGVCLEKGSFRCTACASTGKDCPQPAQTPFGGLSYLRFSRLSSLSSITGALAPAQSCKAKNQGLEFSLCSHRDTHQGICESQSAILAVLIPLSTSPQEQARAHTLLRNEVQSSCCSCSQSPPGRLTSLPTSHGGLSCLYGTPGPGCPVCLSNCFQFQSMSFNLPQEDLHPFNLPFSLSSLPEVQIPT